MCAGVVLFGAGLWAGRATLRPVTSAQSSSDAPVTVAVQQATVGQVLNLNVTMTRAQTPLSVNLLPGIVTHVGSPGSMSQGTCPYAVANQPVCLISGTTPMYRSLSAKAKGPDVAELRAALHALGYLGFEQGDTFDTDTVAAVKTWQEHNGAAPTGVLPLGSVIVAPHLPTAISFGDPLRLGAQFNGGEAVLLQSSTHPAFVLALSNQQVSLVPNDARVTVHNGSRSWPARITSSQPNQDGGVSLSLTAPGGGAVCGNQCDELPAGAQAYLPADVAVVTPTSGPAVPVSAILTQPSGAQVVIVVTADGHHQQTPVTVKASDNGMAVISGLTVGRQVLVNPSANDTSSPTGSASPTPKR